MNTSPQHSQVTATTDQERADYDWAIGINRKLLKCFGLWLYPNEKRWQRIGCNIQVLIVGITIFILIIIPQLMALTKVWQNLTLIADNLIASMPIMISELALIVPWLNKKVLATMFNEIKKDWLEKNPQKKRIMIKNAKVGKQLTIYGLCLGYFCVLFYISAVFFNVVLRTTTNLTDIEGSILPFQAVYLYDISISSRYFITLLTQIVCSLLSCTVYTSINVLFGVFVLHICGQLEILSHGIQKISEEKNYQQRLKLYVQDHNRLIRFIYKVEKVFNLLLLALFASAVITFCLLEFNLISALSGKTTDISPMSLVFYIQFLFYFIFMILIYSWVGEKLITQCAALHMAACHNNWYVKKSQESLQLIILLARSKYPLLLSAGQVVPVRLTTFVSLLKTSIGYASVLRAVQT